MIKRQNAHQMKSHEYKINKQIRNSEFECPLISQVHLTHHMVLNFPTYCYSIVLVWQLCFCFVPTLSFSSSMQESLAMILSSCSLFRAFLEHVGVKRGFGIFSIKYWKLRYSRHYVWRLPSPNSKLHCIIKITKTPFNTMNCLWNWLSCNGITQIISLTLLIFSVLLITVSLVFVLTIYSWL